MRFPYMRRLPPVLVATIATLPSMMLPTPMLAQDAPSAPDASRSVELSVDVGRLTPGSPAALGEALTVRAEFDEPVAVVLHGWRIIRGGIVAGHTSTPFTVVGDASVRPADVDALPASSFYGTSSVGPDDVVTGVGATGARADDPVALVTGNAARLPHGWQDREILVFVAVPSDETVAASTGVTAVIALAAATKAATGGVASGGSAGGAVDVASLLRRHLEATQMCSGWVKNVTLYRETQGWVVPEYYEAHEGGPACRHIPYQQVVDRWHRESGQEPPRWTHEYADGLELLGGALDQELSREGVGFIGGAGRAMTGTMAEFVRAGADVDPDTLLVDDVEGRMSDMAEFAQRARWVGTEIIDGRSVHHLRADDLTDIELEQPDGAHYVLKSADLWIDEATLGVAGMKFELEADEGPMTVEMRNEGFVTLPNGVVVPSLSVMRLSGGKAMSEEDRKKMKKALEDAERMEKDLEKLPAAARRMIEKQIEQLRAMSEGSGGVLGEAVVRLVYAGVNEGPPYPGGLGELDLFGHSFEDVMVTVEWQGGRGEYFMVPRSIGAVGHSGELTATLVIDGLDQEKLRKVEEDVYGGFLVIPGRASGSLEGGESNQTFGPEPVLVQLHNVTYVEATGFTMVTGGYLTFVAGHMPCSTQPRSIGVQLAGVDDSYDLARQFRQDWDYIGCTDEDRSARPR